MGEDGQMNYILNQLKTMTICKVTKKYTESVSVPLVKDILQNKYTNGPDMKAVLWLFNNMVLNTNVTRKQGLYYLPNTIDKWAKKMEAIDVKSSESTVYASDIITDISVIIKSPKNKQKYNDLIREYYIGISEINKLRYHVPNFMYTMGAFIQEPDNVFVVYEKIPGESLESLIKNNRITFPQFLMIYFQVLIALEVGQRNIRFCHFDLHTGNILVRKLSKPFTYTVVLDNQRYDITAHDYLPVIIDFGMSTVTNNSRTIGSHYFSKYGMMHYLIQGSDMYKLLFYSALQSTPTHIHKDILNLFTYYGTDDPYKLVTQKPGFLKRVSFEFARMCSMSKTATYTPLNFAKWIHNKYRSMLTVNITDRDIYCPINDTSTLSKKILKMTDVNSYVLWEYTNGLFKLHNTATKSNIDRKKLLQNDKKLMMRYTTIQIPDEMKLQDYMNRILNTGIRYKKSINILVNRFLNISKFFQELLPYLQLLYTIRELHLDERYKIYRDFVNKFISSKQYRFYEKLHEQVDRTTRWSITLLEST